LDSDTKHFALEESMSRFRLGVLHLVLSLMAFGLIIPDGSHNKAVAQGSSTTGWPHLKYAIYFTSRDVDSLLADPDQFKKTMEYFAPVKSTHVYLEAPSRGEVNVALLKKTADRFSCDGNQGVRGNGADRKARPVGL